jgi:TolB-like protein
MLIGRCLDQLHVYPHLVARTVDRAFQHSANMEFAANLRDRLVCFAIGEHIGRSISGIPGRGMTDEIITDLAQLAGPKVISRTSAMQYIRKRLFRPVYSFASLEGYFWIIQRQIPTGSATWASLE